MKSETLKKNVIYLAVIAVLSSFFLFYNLGSFSLNHLDEGLFASIAHEMEEANDFAVLSVRNEGFFHKQPLRFWLNIFVFKYFGVSNFGARFFSAFFAFALLFCIYALALMLYKKTETAFISVLILLGSPHFLFERFARNVEEDSMGIFFVALFFLLLLAFLKTGKRICWYTGFFVLGLAAMTKLAFAAFAFFVFICFKFFSPKKNGEPKLLAGIFIFSVVVLPWHVWQYFAADINFAKIYMAEILHFMSPSILKSSWCADFFGNDVIGRLGKEIAMGEHADVFYYFHVLSIGFFPWLFFSGMGILTGIHGWMKERNFKILPIIWALLPLLIMLCFYEKRTWRINILFPALALLAADFLVSSFDSRKRIWFVSIFLGGVFILFGINQYGVPFYTPCLWGEHYLNFELLPKGTLWQFDSSCVKRGTVLFICIIAFLSKRFYKKKFRQSLFLGLLILVLGAAMFNSFSLVVRQTYQNDMETVTGKAAQLIAEEENIEIAVLASEPTKMFYAFLTPEFSDYNDGWADYFYLKILGDKNVFVANTEKDYRGAVDKYDVFILDNQNYMNFPEGSLKIIKKTDTYLLVKKNQGIDHV